MRWLTSGGTHGTPPAQDDTFASYDAGYTFSRSGWGTQRPLHQETYLALRHGPARALHGHDDHGSVLLYADGQPLITDPGKYAYGSTAMRAHVRTAQAHSRITLDGCPPQGNSTEVVDIDHGPGYDRIVLDVDVCEGARWLRTVVFLRDSGALVVLDELDADTRATQHWQLEPGAHTTRHSPQFLTATWPSGARLTIEQLLAVGETTVVTGGTDPLRGWVSQAYGEVTPAPNLATSAQQTPRRDLLTVLRPGTTVDDPRAVLRTEPDAYHLELRTGEDRTYRVVVPRRLSPPR